MALMSMNTIKDQNRAIWGARLVSALRTVTACSIVGCTTLYGPAPLRRVLTYPSVSYVTAILIVSEATLGDTLRGFCQALYATVQVLFPSWLSLWIIGPARLTRELAAVAVAISSFVVALPESTPLLTKRLAFGQMVIVYVGTVVHGRSTGSFMHPIHVASSTTVGALASVLAVLLPFPRLAHREVRKACRLYAENASQRLSLVVEAISAQHTSTTHDLIAQQKYLSQTGLKLLQTVNNNLVRSKFLVFVIDLYKENGYWSGFTIAISFVTGRQATFVVANARAQGTAMGSIYGVLCSFIFQRVHDLRFLPLLPWIIFTSFLIHSRTYGQAGAFSAAIVAFLILGWKGYGAPTDFAIVRVTEATIGLICFILVELLLKAEILAKAELSESIELLREWMENIILRPHQKNMSTSRKL